MLVSQAFDEIGRYTLALLVIIIPLLILGWFLQRTRILEAAALREGYTGTNPVLAKSLSDRPDPKR